VRRLMVRRTTDVEAALRANVWNMGSSCIGRWLVSCGAMVAFVDLKLHLQPEKFQWDVVLLQALEPSPVTPAEAHPQETVPPACRLNRNLKKCNRRPSLLPGPSRGHRS
jgi:hypothetical protein